MSDKAVGLICIGIMAVCIGLPLLLSRPIANNAQFSRGNFLKPNTPKGINGGSTYDNMEYWHITWDLENLVPTDIAVKRHATETMEI